MKTSTQIISLLLCLTVAMAQDNQDNQDNQESQDNLPDGNQALADELESDLNELKKKLVVKKIGRILLVVFSLVFGLVFVFFHFLMISIANLLQISFSTFNLVNVPLVGNVILTNDYRCGR